MCCVVREAATQQEPATCCVVCEAATQQEPATGSMQNFPALPVTIVVNNIFAVEDGEKGDQQPPVPVICHTTAIVALSCQVDQSVQWELLVLIQEHLNHQ